MAQQVMHAQMGGETGGTEELIEAGAVTFGLEYHTLRGGEEEGICIHVYGNPIPGDDGDDKELLRFDCFKVAPHYHYRNSTVKKNERLRRRPDPGVETEGPAMFGAFFLFGRRRARVTLYLECCPDLFRSSGRAPGPIASTV